MTQDTSDETYLFCELRVLVPDGCAMDETRQRFQELCEEGTPITEFVGTCIVDSCDATRRELTVTGSRFRINETHTSGLARAEKFQSLFKVATSEAE